MVYQQNSHLYLLGDTHAITSDELGKAIDAANTAVAAGLVRHLLMIGAGLHCLTRWIKKLAKQSISITAHQLVTPLSSREL